MKAKELMIGDWVRLKDDDSDFQMTVRVEGIDPNNNLFSDNIHDDGTATKGWCSVECFEPIPLTAEILENNGFNKTGAYIFEDDYEHQILIYLKNENYTGGAYTYIDAHCGCLDISEMPVEHVHELQHALKLCGIEKEIIL